MSERVICVVRVMWLCRGVSCVSCDRVGTCRACHVVVSRRVVRVMWSCRDVSYSPFPRLWKLYVSLLYFFCAKDDICAARWEQLGFATELIQFTLRFQQWKLSGVAAMPQEVSPERLLQGLQFESEPRTGPAAARLIERRRVLQRQLASGSTQDSSGKQAMHGCVLQQNIGLLSAFSCQVSRKQSGSIAVRVNRFQISSSIKAAWR